MSLLTLETKKYSIKIDNFEGPIDLLCHLIDKNKMDIYDINLSEITDQYIEYLKEQEKLNNEKKALRDELDSILYSRSYKFISKVKKIIRR